MGSCCGALCVLRRQSSNDTFRKKQELEHVPFEQLGVILGRCEMKRPGENLRGTAAKRIFKLIYFLVDEMLDENIVVKQKCRNFSYSLLGYSEVSP